MEDQPNLDDFDKVFGPQSTERIDPSVDDNGSRRLRHSSTGRASFWLAIASIALWLAGMASGGGLIIISGIFSVICNLVGTILGIIALSQKGYNKGYAIAGTAINSVLILTIVIGILWIISQF